MLKIVCDTNIYISAILFGGTCEKILELARQRQIIIYVSTPILTETLNVLKRKGMSKNQLEKTLTDLSTLTISINTKTRLFIVKNPDADNRILECAIAAKADFLISGDTKHILPLNKIRGITITSPGKFLGLLK